MSKDNKIVVPTKKEKEFFDGKSEKKIEDPGKLKGPDGNPIPRNLCVEVGEYLFPYRVISKEILNAENSKIRDLAILTQSTDQFNMILLALLSLAKDIYSRDPKGSTHFYDICKQLKMNILDADRKTIDIEKVLEKVLGI